ncbi:MAG: SMP-30/gluconolactonase/LRE family protein [Verrucomicrobiota bacterium]
MVKSGIKLQIREATVGLIFGGMLVATGQGQEETNYPRIGSIERLDPAIGELIGEEAEIEVLAGGFLWLEGPVWVPDEESASGGYLLFSDIPRNRVMKWEEGVGTAIFLEPAGFTGPGEYGGEPGSNGLLLDQSGTLIFCEHGDRRVSMLPVGSGKMTLADRYQGKRLNSPNDAVIRSNGDIYFTDPPYGLPERWDDPRRELEFCGVYRISKDTRELTLLADGMTRPNGIAFSPDETVLYVAQSDPEAAIWKAFPVLEDGTLGEGEVFADVTAMGAELPGLPDGLKLDVNGNLFATGPGGVHIMSPDGTLLGRIDTGERISNVAWGDDGTVLYLTSDMYLCRVKTKTKGAGW